MPNLKKIKNRINSIKSTTKVTNAMKVIAASKIKKLKVESLSLNNACKKIHEIFTEVLNHNLFFNIEHPYLNLLSNDKKIGTDLYVIFSSERGLCGGFNSSLMKKFFLEVKNFEKFKIITIGKKAHDQVKINFSQNIHSQYNLSKQFGISDISQSITKDIIEFEDLKNCFFMYNKYNSSISQTPEKFSLFNFDIKENNPSQYEFEGSKITENTLNIYIRYCIQSALCESRLSEESMRMISMDNSSKNAKKITNDLTLMYHRQRQSLITKEITEIISGVESS